MQLPFLIMMQQVGGTHITALLIPDNFLIQVSATDTANSDTNPGFSSTGHRNSCLHPLVLPNVRHGEP